MSRVLNDVDEEAGKPVDEVPPAAGILSQAAVEKAAIEVRHGHIRIPTVRCPHDVLPRRDTELS